MPDTLRRLDQNGYPLETRIIGIELRYRDQYGRLEEVALIPCDVRLPPQMHAARPASINCTIHTSQGDTNFPEDARLPLG